MLAKMTKGALAALVMLSASVSLAIPRVELGTNHERTVLSLSLDPNDMLTKKLVDALLKSSEIQEVVNPWVQPGTHYKGPGIHLTIESKYVALQISVPKEDEAGVVVSGQFARLTAKKGVIPALYNILLTTKSNAVTRHGEPSKVSLGEGDVVILEADTFAKKSIGCGPMGRDQTEVITCALNLHK